MPPVKRWLIPATTLLLLRAVPSCSSDAATNVPTEVPLQDVPGVLAETACKVTLDCLGPAADVAATRADCVARVTRQFEDGEFALFENSIDRGLVDYDGTVVADCTRSLEEAGCDILTNRLKSICPDLVTGHVESGEECAIDAECEAGHFCKAESACPGTCAPLASAGEDCLQSDDCRDGLVCGGSRKCLEPVADGEACGGDTGQECAPTSACTGTEDAEAGTCKSIGDAFSREEGEACDPRIGDFCTADFVCAAVAIEEGEAVFECEAPTDDTACHLAIPESCPEEQFCVLSGLSVEGECQPLPGDGEPCGSTQPGQLPSRCRTDMVCVTGTCRQTKRLGGGCTEGTECYSGVCLEGACAATLCSSEE